MSDRSYGFCDGIAARMGRDNRWNDSIGDHNNAESDLSLIIKIVFFVFFF